MSVLMEFIVSLVLAGLTVMIHYEVLRLTSVRLPKLTIPPRTRILVVIFAAFFAHLSEIALYAGAYIVLGETIGVGQIVDQPVSTFYDYFYFSMTTYSTLGIGDVYPLGSLRLLTGMESLVGLMMITWTASFTYLAMEKFWGLHDSRS